MELRHLRYFAAVAETRHFGRAAERLHLAQPALSQSIRQLENELGAPLFTRTTRQVSLTPAGEFLHEEAQRVLGAVEDSVRGVRRIAGGRLGLVRIAFTGTAAFTHLPRIARTVKRDLPGVALEIHADLLTPAQSAGLREGSLDLGVLRPPTSGDEHRDCAPSRSSRWSWPSRPTTGWPPSRWWRWPTCAPSTSSLYADSRLGGQRGRRAQLQARPGSPRTGARSARAPPYCWHWSPPASVSHSCPRPCAPSPWPDVVFRDVVDAATIELALAWRAESPSPSSGRCWRRSTRPACSPTPLPRPPRPTRSADEDHRTSRRFRSPSPTPSR